MQSLVDRAPRGFFGGREPIQSGIEARLAGFFKVIFDSDPVPSEACYYLSATVYVNIYFCRIYYVEVQKFCNFVDIFKRRPNIGLA